jgi:hypothetical protein
MTVGLDGGRVGALLAGVVHADALIAAARGITGQGRNPEDLRASKGEEEDETAPP